MAHHICSTPTACSRASVSGQPSILVIDDDVVAWEIFALALKACGYAVIMTASGTEGIAAAQSHPPDLILLDLRLPDCFGTAVICRLQHHALQIPFVLVSGFLTTPVTVEAMRLGAVDVLEKPVDIDHLIDTIDSALGVMHQPVAAPKEPRTAAERWAAYVVRACESEGDLKTLAEWARFAGVSYSSLRESCRMLGIPPARCSRPRPRPACPRSLDARSRRRPRAPRRAR